MEQLAYLRARKWQNIPARPGVYWWYFPDTCLDRFRIPEFCSLRSLALHRSETGKVCLYHGMAKTLSERVEWHAAQKLTLGALESGFLSTFRLTLLALNDFNYLRGETQIDAFMDSLDIRWQAFATLAEAKAAEASELAAGPHYPLNIQNNRRAELANFTRHLKATRNKYKERYLRAPQPSADENQP